LDSSQTLTFKTLDGATVLTSLDFNNNSSIRLFEASTNGSNKIIFKAPVNLAADYALILPTDQAQANQFLKNDGAGNLSWAPASGGSGRNYLSDWNDASRSVGTVVTGLTSTGNRTSSQTSWGASATADLTIANNATLPLRETGDFLIDSSTTTAGAFVESPMFNLDLVDLSKAVVLSFDITGNAADGNYDVVVIRYNSSGTYQETISVAGNASAGSPASAKLPTGTTTFKGFFVSSNTQTDFYSVRIRKILAVNDDFQIDSLFVGPQSLSAGVAITESNLFAPIFTNSTGLTFTGSGQYQRVANSLVLNLSVSITGTGSVASPLRLNLPLAGITAVAGDYAGGNGGIKNADINNRALCVRGISGQNYVEFSQASTPSTSLNGTAFSDTASSNAFYFLDISATIPISQWASNVTMAERQVEEYLSYYDVAATSVAVYSDQSKVSRSPEGSNFVSMISSNTGGSVISYDMNTQTPILPTDVLIIEAKKSGDAQWSTGHDILRREWAANCNYGASVRAIGSNTVRVEFGSSGATPAGNMTYGTAGADPWSGYSTTKWRVRKVSSGGQVGYPVSARNIVGDTSGTAVPAGIIGEQLRLTGTTGTLVSNTAINITSITLTKGVWDVSGIASISASVNPTGTVQNVLALSTNSASLTGTVDGDNQIQNGQAPSSGNYNVGMTIPQYRVVLSTDTTYYLVIRAFASSSIGTQTATGRISAARIA
jgi:hypothetical protein